MARDQDLDLVEVAPNERPPVCKIMSWSKFKYELSKKQKGSSKGKAKDEKEMWFSPYIDEGDIKHKIKKVKEFLKDGHPVKITIRVKGRVPQDVIKSQLRNILGYIKGEYDKDGRTRFEGRNVAVRIVPKK